MVLGASEGWHGAPETPFLCILCVLRGWAEGSALPHEPSLTCPRPTSGRPVMASQEESAHQHDPGTWDLGSVQPLLAWWGPDDPAQPPLVIAGAHIVPGLDLRTL